MELALETADIALMADDLLKLPLPIELRWVRARHPGRAGRTDERLVAAPGTDRNEDRDGSVAEVPAPVGTDSA